MSNVGRGVESIVMAKAIGYKIESCKADHMLFNGDFYTATNSSE